VTGIPAAGRVLSPAAEPAQRVGKRWIALIALANLGLYLGYFGPLEVLLPNQVQAVAGTAHKVVVLGWVTGIGAAVAMLANPVAGALSDRTTGRFGRRHPWTVGGALAGAAALALLAGQHTVAGLIIGWCLAQAGLNAMQASVTAGVPDHVPVEQRGAVSGWIGMPQTLGVVLAVALVTVAATGNAGYLLIGGLVVLCALPFALATPDPPLARAGRGHPGAAVGGGPGQGSGHHQHRQLRAAGAGPGDRRAAGQPAWRVPDSLFVGRRDHRVGVSVRVEDPFGALTAGDAAVRLARYWR
jgi:MFS family permease